MADRVTFTPGSAERIAKVVRIVEAGNRNTAGLPTSPRLQSTPQRLIVGKYTGAWGIEESIPVRILPGTETVLVSNYCIPAPETENENEERFVVFGNQRAQVIGGSTSRYVAVEIQLQSTYVTCQTTLTGPIEDIDGFAGDEVQLLGHDESACLHWYSITTCETAVATVPDEYGWFY